LTAVQQEKDLFITCKPVSRAVVKTDEPSHLAGISAIEPVQARTRHVDMAKASRMIGCSTLEHPTHAQGAVFHNQVWRKIV